MRTYLLGLSVVALLFTAGCGGDDDGSNTLPTSTPTGAQLTATPTATDTPPPTATSTPPPTDTQTRAPTATPTQTPTATEEATATETPTATPTNTASLVEELESSGVGKYLGMFQPSRTGTTGVWEAYFYDPAEENAICLKGGEYQVLIRRGTTNNVLLYLEGGGACWSNATCWEGGFFAKDTSVPFFGGGIFEFNNPDNPFRDWNIVYAPYCDGSVFAGDNIPDYAGGRTYHHGQQNVSAAVTLLEREFPDPDLLVVSGSSAGGYGTFSGYGVTRVAFPETPILVLNDSGPGLNNLDEVQDIQDRATNWRFQEFYPQSCELCTTQPAYLSEWALERDPTLRVGYFSNLQDGVIRTFLRLLAQDFEALLRETTDDIQSRQPDRFKRFFIQGEDHTILEIPGVFYDTEIAGTSFRDWTADFLTDGPAWEDLIEGANPLEVFASPNGTGRRASHE
jgi:hypothetical protein